MARIAHAVDGPARGQRGSFQYSWLSFAFGQRNLPDLWGSLWGVGARLSVGKACWAGASRPGGPSRPSRAPGRRLT
jgi:hypothetical protein